MEVSGVVFRRVPCFSGAGIMDGHSHASSSYSKPYFPGASVRFSGELRCLLMGASTRRPIRTLSSGFSDDGHMQYYYGYGSTTTTTTRCGTAEGKKKDKEKDLTKKKMKLLKGLSKDLSMFSQIGFGLNSDHGLASQVKGKMISEAAELLLGQLQQLKAEEKELKRKKKEEKTKLKIERRMMQNKLDCESSASSSSSESSDDCGRRQVVDMSRLKIQSQPTLNEFQEATLAPLPNTLITQQGNIVQEEECTETSRSSSSCSNVGGGSVGGLSSNVGGEHYAEKKIEVCMGGKCKKSGAATLLEEFQRVVGVEGAVVGCKCMGKCRDGPNVKVLNGVQADDGDSVRTPPNPLCIGVGFEDVALIVSNFFGDSMGLSASAAAAAILEG
uniref:Diacylglycerol O-acyltransferase 3, cytosolic n=1 Tax=Davidia involucrata TaxID=16924 RepID=A0A5B7BTD8_DAVIN